MAVTLYRHLRAKGVMPSEAVVLAALKECARRRDVVSGESIHRDVAEDGGGDEPGMAVANTLVDLYAKCGCLAKARWVFERMPRRSVVSWNALIMGCAQNGHGDVALELFARMQEQGFTPDARTFVAALKACASSSSDGFLHEHEKKKMVEHGRMLHSRLAKCGLESDVFVACALVDLYSRGGEVVDARKVFDNTATRDSALWNAMIAAYARSADAGDLRRALELEERMHRQGSVGATTLTFVAALGACSGLEARERGHDWIDDAGNSDKLAKVMALDKGRAIHGRIVSCGYETDILVANALVDMYCKCGELEDARSVFDKMVRHDTVAWNAMLIGYARIADGEKCLAAFFEMQEEGCEPDGRTFVILLSCVGFEENKSQHNGSLARIRCIHSWLSKSGLETELLVTCMLMDVYSKCGSIQDAFRVFDTLVVRDVILWNVMIQGCVCCGDEDAALVLLERMQDEGCVPNHTSLMAACTYKASTGDDNGKAILLKRAKGIHSRLSQRAEAGVQIYKALVDVYVRCGAIGEARQLFDTMEQQRPLRDVSLWNALMTGYIQCGNAVSALEMFSRMKAGGLSPNSRTFAAALKACAILLDLEQGRAIQLEICSAGLESDPALVTCLVNFFAKCGRLGDARKVFDRQLPRDLACWNAMIAAYTQDGKGEEALQMFRCMSKDGLAPNTRTFVAALNACSALAAQEAGRRDVFGRMVKQTSLETARQLHSQVAAGKGLLDVFLGSSLVDVYAKCGSMSDAVDVFNRMPLYNVVVWNSIILGYAENDEADRALELFSRMDQRGLSPDVLSYAAVLKACGSLGALDSGRQIYKEICSAGLSNDPLVVCSVISFFGRCGSMKDAHQVFNCSTGVHADSVAWNALMNGYCNQGDARRVFRLFEEMQQRLVEVDGFTFLSLLTACSRTGHVEQGKQYFELMTSPQFDIPPSYEHYSCMVDLLGRSNRMDEAVALAKRMPVEGVSVWKSLLSSCRRWKNVEAAKLAFEQLQRLDHGDGAAYVLMANACSGGL